MKIVKENAGNISRFKNVFSAIVKGITDVAKLLDWTITMRKSDIGQESDLLPCPFCAKAPKLTYFYKWEIVCECGVILANDAPEKNALICHWNSRLLTADKANLEINK